MALTPAEATALVLSRVTPLRATQCALLEAQGRVLHQDVYAERDNPPFDRVCMDGVAMDSRAFTRGVRRFRIQATQAAGAVPLTLAGDEAAIEAMTGAVLPHGTDCVIPLEEYDLTDGVLTLKPEATAEPWRNVQRRGSDSRPGVPMLKAGMRLGAAEVAVVASAGLPEISVSRLPRVMVISTGDELIEPGEPIAEHQIRRSNAYGVVAALQRHGFTATTEVHVRDDETLMRARLAAALASSDVVILSGGVSKGKFDYVPAALKSLQVREEFYQVAQRPGRPMWFGVGPEGQLVFGLPGNPVSTLVCLARYVLPALNAALGCKASPVARVAMDAASGGRKMTYFMPVKLRHDAAPGMATACPPSGSGDFLALAGTHGFVELPPQPDGCAAGFVADYYAW
jgi:molybdopterin molybdotransferase